LNQVEKLAIGRFVSDQEDVSITDGWHNCLFSLSIIMFWSKRCINILRWYNDMIWVLNMRRILYRDEYTMGGNVSVLRLRRRCSRHPLTVFVRVCVEATRWGWSDGREPGCGTLRQCESPSWFIDLVAYPSSSSSSATPLFVYPLSRPPSYRRAILFLFCSSFSRCLLDPALFSLLFRRTFCLREWARASIINILSCTVFVKFLSVHWKFYV